MTPVVSHDPLPLRHAAQRFFEQRRSSACLLRSCSWVPSPRYHCKSRQALTQVWLIDPTSGDELAALTPPGNFRVSDAAFSPDNRIVAVAYDRHILLWDLPTLRQQLAGLSLEWPEK